MPYPGIIAGPDRAFLRYRYEGAPEFQVDVSPIKGFGLVSGSPGTTINVIGGSSYLYANGVAAITVPFDQAMKYSTTDAPTVDVYVLTGVDIEYQRAVAGDTLSVYVIEFDSEAAATVVLHAWSEVAEFTTVAAITTWTSPALTDVLNPGNKAYLFYIVMSGAASQIELGKIRVRYTKMAVE